MKTVWRFPVSLDMFQLQMPEGARVLTCALQGGALVLWALCDPAAPVETRRFRTVGTGHEHRNEVLQVERYIGTYVVEARGLVFHLFEESPVPALSEPVNVSVEFLPVEAGGLEAIPTGKTYTCTTYIYKRGKTRKTWLNTVLESVEVQSARSADQRASQVLASLRTTAAWTELRSRLRVGNVIDLYVNQQKIAVASVL